MGHWPSFTEYVYSPVKDLVLPPDSVISFMSNHRKLQVYPGLRLPQLQIHLAAVYKPMRCHNSLLKLFGAANAILFCIYTTSKEADLPKRCLGKLKAISSPQPISQEHSLLCQIPQSADRSLRLSSLTWYCWGEIQIAPSVFQKCCGPPTMENNYKITLLY